MTKNTGRRPLQEYAEDELLALLDRPEEHESLTDSELDEFMNFGIAVYGITSQSELVPKLLAWYQLYLRRVPPALRRENYSATRAQVQSGDMSVNGLLPYLCADDDMGIVSTAGLDYAVLHPLAGNDPLTGPQSLLRLIGNGTLSNPAAAIGGLVMLGDQRVMELVSRIRHTLTNPDVETVTHCRSGYVFAATIEFYLTWLEELTGDYDDAIFGTVAAALCGLTRRSDPVVRSIERVFPSTPTNAIRLLGGWSLGEYADTIRPRLQALALREREPRVMPYVVQAWSLG